MARKQSSRPLAELKTLVIGGGAVGLMAALFLRMYGCRDLVVAETNAERRGNFDTEIIEHCVSNST